MSDGQPVADQDTQDSKPKLPPPRSVQAGSSLWWWFIILIAVISVWVIAMVFWRSPNASDDDGIILMNPSASASANP